MQGLQIFEVFDRCLDAETIADWEKARAEHGDAATSEHLPRTIQKRRADALWQIFIDAAANLNSAVPADFVHDIMWDADTFEDMAEKFFGEEDDSSDLEDEDDIAEYDGEFKGDARAPTAPSDPRDCIETDTIGCQIIDGIPVDATEMFDMSIVGRIRRVLIDAKSMVTDQGAARRFTGGARLAVKLSHAHCVWPGCCTPVSKCETDHVLEHSREGRTNPGNGAPLCGKHNRWKQKGFTIYRDHYGSWHTLRPDGTEIPV